MKGQSLCSGKVISQSLASSEVGQAQGSCGLAHWTHLLGLHPVVDDGEVQSERQRAKDQAEATSRNEESGSRFRREKTIKERSRMGVEAASHFVCFLPRRPTMLNL